VEYGWGAQLTHLGITAGKLDLILGSDVVYGGSDGILLLQTILDLISHYGNSETTTVMMSFGNRKRGTSEHLHFLAHAQKRFLNCSRLELPEDLGSGAADFYDGIDLYELSGVRALSKPHSKD